MQHRPNVDDAQSTELLSGMWPGRPGPEGALVVVGTLYVRTCYACGPGHVSAAEVRTYEIAWMPSDAAVARSVHNSQLQ